MKFRLFAAPGIDSDISEYGSVNSGAGRSPETETAKTAPYDWVSWHPYWGNKTGRLIGNFPETQAQPAHSLRIRRRGIAVWDGSYQPNTVNRQKPGGAVSLNPGADSRIAGGPGEASSMVRLRHRVKKDAGMKLPVLPTERVRGGTMPLPSGGDHGMIAAPLTPKLPGLPSIIKIVQQQKASENK